MLTFSAEWDQAVPLKMSTPSRDDILLLAHELGTSWKMIGRFLGVSDAVLEQIEEDEPKLFDKCYSKYEGCVFLSIYYMTTMASGCLFIYL